MSTIHHYDFYEKPGDCLLNSYAVLSIDKNLSIDSKYQRVYIELLYKISIRIYSSDMTETEEIEPLRMKEKNNWHKNDLFSYMYVYLNNV